MTDRERTVLLREFKDFRNEVRDWKKQVDASIAGHGTQLAMLKGAVAAVALLVPAAGLALRIATGG